MDMIYKKQTTALLLIATMTMLAYNLCAQSDEGFIYGTVTTIENQKYTGQMRWGKEEAFWTDHMNVSKYDNENLEYLSRDEIRELKGTNRDWFDWGFGDWRMSGDEGHLHILACQFGEIETIEIHGRQRALFTLRNGKTMRIKGEGYNDIGAKIRVMDPELGIVAINWREIDKIEFAKTPSKLEERMGYALYGEVESSGGKFTGYIQWDHDERLSKDELDGDTPDGDVSIKFGKIKSIKSNGNSSYVVLKSGRSFDLRGTNDVNRQNGGIIVTASDGSRVDIPWDEFDKVTFADEVPGSGLSYDSFKEQKELFGVVKTAAGDEIEGKIVYDLDEQYDFEMIQGKYRDLEYFFPLRIIQKIVPRNYDNSYVELKNGQKLLLGDAQDVSDRNDGILVFEGKRDPRYIAWEDVETITFNE